MVERIELKTERQHILGPRGRADSVLYGLLREEWLERRAR